MIKFGSILVLSVPCRDWRSIVGNRLVGNPARGFIVELRLRRHLGA